MGNAKPRGARRRESQRNGQERHTEEKTELLDDITEEVYQSEVFMDTVIYLMKKIFRRRTALSGREHREHPRSRT